ncbi:MAG: type III-B CRISPR module-associated Cmr3 family protein [Egibacteraceae bacterium]
MHELTVTVEEPLMLGATFGVANVLDTHRHIPGSVMRGALAARWIVDHGTPDRAPEGKRQEFLDLFEGRVRYGPLFVEGSAIHPLAAWRCKYRAADPGCDRVVADRAHGAAHAACEVCGGRLEPGKGEVAGLRDWHLGESTRTRLTPDEIPEDGNLFSRRHLQPGTVLRGWVCGDHPWLDDLPPQVWLGGRRSVGGLARLEQRKVADPEPEPRADGLVHVELQSPGVFVDRCGRPLPEFPLAEIAARLGCEVDLERAWVRTTRVGGWHAASRLPKPVDVAVTAGSAALVRPRGEVTNAELARLACSGLGLRAAEGFGWVTVNPPPWQAPSPAAPTPPPARELAAKLPEELRDWLVPRLKQLAVELEHDGGRRTEEILERRRLRRLSPTLRQRVEELVRNGDLDVLNDTIALMEAR